MYRLVLKKSWINPSGRKLFVGQIINVDRSLGRHLLEDGIGEVYEGRYPPEEKIRSEFFKPK